MKRIDFIELIDTKWLYAADSLFNPAISRNVDNILSPIIQRIKRKVITNTYGMIE